MIGAVEMMLSGAGKAEGTPTWVYVLACIGLAVGLVVFFVVVYLLQDTLKPLREVLEDVKSAETAPMLKHGVKGTDQLSRTQSLAGSVPDLAVAYMRKLNLPVDTAPPGRKFPETGSAAGWR